MNTLQITNNGAVLLNVGGTETGRFGILISFETKDGKLVEPLNIVASGYIPETGEHQKWANYELTLPAKIEIQTGSFETSPYVVFDPSAKK